MLNLGAYPLFPPYTVYTHTFNGPLSGTAWVSQYQKRKTDLDFTVLKQETVSGSGISCTICKSAPHSTQITTPAPHYSVFTGQMPFLPPNQQRLSTEGTVQYTGKYHGAVCGCSVVWWERWWWHSKWCGGWMWYRDWRQGWVWEMGALDEAMQVWVYKLVFISFHVHIKRSRVYVTVGPFVYLSRSSTAATVCCCAPCG